MAERPLLAKVLAVALAIAWAAPLYTSDHGALTGFGLAAANIVFAIVPLLLLALAWASWTERQWSRLGAIAATTLFLDVAATLTDGERVLFHPAAWLALVVLIFALAAALENRIGALLPVEFVQAVPFLAVVLALTAVSPIYISFQAQKRHRNPLYSMFVQRPEPLPQSPPAPGSALR